MCLPNNLREQTCPEIRDLSRNKGLFLRYGATGGDGISGRVLLFLDASCYFWTRRGISARVHNERAAGRAGGRGKDGKIISGHVSGRAGGRTGWQSYFWTRLAISGRVVVFLHAFITRGRPGGRAGEGRMAKLFLDTSSGGRAGGQAAKVISGHVFSKNISGHVSGRAGGRTGWQSYFWTCLGISARVHNERAAGRAGGRGKDGKTISGHVFGRAGGRTGCQSYFWTRLPQFFFWARLRAGGRAAEERLPKLLRFAWQAQDFGSFLIEKLRRPRTKCSFWKFVAGKVEEASHEMLVLEVCCLKS